MSHFSYFTYKKKSKKRKKNNLVLEFGWLILPIKSFLKWPVGNCGALSEMAGFLKVVQMFDGNRHNSQRRCGANQTNRDFVLEMFWW